MSGIFDSAFPMIAIAEFTTPLQNAPRVHTLFQSDAPGSAASNPGGLDVPVVL
jgi:hypothetical protein